MISSHLKSLINIFRYDAPKGCRHLRRVIQDGCEEIEVIISGRGSFVDNHVRVDVGPGGILWYAPGDSIEVDSHEHEPYSVIVFVFEIGQTPKLHRPQISHWRNVKECIQFCLEVYREFQSKQFDANSFTICLYSRLYWESTHTGMLQDDAGYVKELSKAIQYIEDNYFMEINVKNIARAASISMPYLHQLFKKHLKNTPLQFVIEKRLERAKHLLLSTDMSVKAIAVESGFKDDNSFCRTFRKKYKQSPKVFRSN